MFSINILERNFASHCVYFFKKFISKKDKKCAINQCEPDLSGKDEPRKTKWEMEAKKNGLHTQAVKFKKELFF
jgi:hypothetical protein